MIDRLLKKYPDITISETTQAVDENNFHRQKTKLESRHTEGGAIGVVWSDNNKIILTKRSGLHAGWALPGGTVESNEEFDVAFLRELVEETSVHATIVRLALIEKKIFKAPNNELLSMYLAVFEAHALPGEIATTTEGARQEGLEIAEFDKTSLPKNMILQDRQKIDLIISFNK